MLKQLELALADAPATAWPLGDFLTFREGRMQYKVRNTRERLGAITEAARKCPGWTGKRTAKPARRAGGVMYTYCGPTNGDFKLLIPTHLAPPEGFHRSSPNTTLQLGSFTLTLHHRTRHISGKVPAAWLVDLNVPSPDEGDLS